MARNIKVCEIFVNERQEKFVILLDNPLNNKNCINVCLKNETINHVKNFKYLYNNKIKIELNNEVMNLQFLSHLRKSHTSKLYKDINIITNLNTLKEYNGYNINYAKAQELLFKLHPELVI